MKAGRTALLIADSAMLLRYVSSVLRARMPGLKLITARRAGEGFLQADRHRPDLVLLDFNLPDLAGEEFCGRLAARPATARLPVIALCGKATDPGAVRAAQPNVLRILAKPFTPEGLTAAVLEVLELGPVPTPAPPPPPDSRNAAPSLPAIAVVHPVPALSTRQRARLSLPQTSRVPVWTNPPAAPARPSANGAHAPGDGGRNGRHPPATSARIAFRGTTATFSLPACLRAAVRESLTGVLRVFSTALPPPGSGDGDDDDGTPAPTEVYFRAGIPVLVTTREPELSPADDPRAAPAGVPPGAWAESALAQRETGCPPPLWLLARGWLGEREATVLAEDLGQRLFARMWVQPRLAFEFEQTGELPGFVGHSPAAAADAGIGRTPAGDGQDAAIWLNNWLLSTLRRLRPEELPAPGGGRLEGVPAYTREGYETICRLHLTEREAGFARLVNGRESLRDIAGRLGLEPGAALLVLFRFRAVGLMDLWPGAALARAGTVEAAAG